jgi:hypothetical protein
MKNRALLFGFTFVVSVPAQVTSDRLLRAP